MTTQKTKTLLIMGTSGAGKSVLKDTLVSKYSKVFNNVTQVSTRQPRSPDDKSYDFITVEKYKEIEDTLLCKTDFNGNLYGSKIKEFKKRKVNILIVDKKGIYDYINSDLIEDHEYVILSLDRYDYASITDIRSDRDAEFLRNEHMTVLEVAEKENTYYHDVTVSGFIDAELVHDLCQNLLNGVSSAEIKLNKYKKEGDSSAI